MKQVGIVLLKPTQLLTHPRNMRKFYPEDQVREMADSILAHGGVIEPLVVVKGKERKYLVMDGNMRLAGGRLLGDKCPALECKIVDMAEADQLLAMASANQVRYDVDPVSEALHYKALQDQGLSIREISKRTGIYEVRIRQRIVLADLEEPIQKMIVENKLPSSHLVAEALLKLSPKRRLDLARKIAANPNTKIQTIIKACEKLTAGKNAEKLKRPAVQLAKIEDCAGKVQTKDLRKAAARVCRSCNQMELDHGREPAWSMLAHTADQTCDECDLKTMQSICEGCPAVELLRNLKDAMRGGRK